MLSSGRDDREGPDACGEHVWTDTAQLCRLCGQVRLQGPDEGTALTTWYDAISLREHRGKTRHWVR